MAKRRLFLSPVNDLQVGYAPRHAAPSLLLRAARWCSLVAGHVTGRRTAPRLVRPAPPPPAPVQTPWPPRLTVIVIEARPVSPLAALAPYPLPQPDQAPAVPVLAARGAGVPVGAGRR